MAAGHPKSKPKDTETKTATQRSQPCTSSLAGNQHLSEASLRKLSRAELQKLAREHGIKANLKSEYIIQNLLKITSTKKNARPADEDLEEGPSRKKLRTSKTPLPLTPRSRAETRLDDARPSCNPHPPTQSSPSISAAESLKELFSDTDSEMTDVTQPDYATPKSSRANTPQPSDTYNTKRTVHIMQAISQKDQEMLTEIAKLRETAAKLKKQTQDIRDVVCSERARRERMETYFTYWQNGEGTWPRKWLYGESMVPQKYLKPRDIGAGPPTLLTGKGAQEGNPRNSAVTGTTAQRRADVLTREQQQVAGSQNASPRVSASVGEGSSGDPSGVE